jgi:hypothetical protein
MQPVTPARLARNLLLWLVPVTIVWILVTPVYNQFLITAGENLLHLLESPDVTDLVAHETHHALVLRRDFPADHSRVYSIRVTDLHFHLILLGVLFLAVPGVPLRERLGNLGWALLISVFFHLALIFFWVKFAYATQLGSWSLEHYSHAQRELLGIAKHVLDLPIKLALPLVLWAFFYLKLLLPRRVEGESVGS